MYPTNQTQADNSLSSMLSGDNRYKTAMVLSGIGSAMQGNGSSNSLQQMLMFDMMRDKQNKEAEGRRRSQELLSGIMGGQPRSTSFNPRPIGLPNKAGAVASDTMAALGKATFKPGDRESFVKAMMPHAMRVSQRTGLDPRLVIAQAAQETGWGRSAPNNNFFGIKSHGKGGGQVLSTRENLNGQNVTINDSFRTYGGMGQSADDYANFLMENPRYRQMLNSPDLDSQLAALGQSGYATDPNYAQSVGAIARSIGAPQGGVQTAQTGGITRDQVMMVLQDEFVDDTTKQFVLGEFRAQQKGGGLTGKERYMNVDGVLYDVSGQQPVAVTQAKPDDSAAMQKISRIKQAYGVDDKTAVGIADGVLKVSRDPFTEQIQITNLATNETWLPSTGQQGAPSQGQSESQPAQTTQPAQPDQNDLTFGQPYEDAENAFGLEGMVRRGINSASDFVTGREVFPDTGQTQRDFDLLREDITQDLQSAYGQRLPSWALQAVRDLTPSAGGFQGQGAAQGKLRALGRKFEQELQAVEQSLAPQNRRGTSPEEWAKLEGQRSALRRSLQKIQNALGGFGESDTGNQTSSGVNWRVVE